MTKIIIISHLDIVKQKNLRDIVHLSEIYQYKFHVFSYEPCGLSMKNIHFSTYQSSLINRFFQYLILILRYNRQISHVEIYTGCGNFWVLECLICRIMGIKIIACERGTPLLNINKNRTIIRNLKIFALRHLSSKIWIRELWMTEKLNTLKIPSSKVCFIPNAISVNEKTFTSKSSGLNSSFLWANSFKDFRHLDWVYNAFKQVSLSTSNFKLTVIGDLSSKGTIPCPRNQEYAEKLKFISNTTVLPFCTPFEFYLCHTFFILPADIVYLNNSLLEAMAYGCIPIISDVQGSELIVPDANHGVRFTNNEESFRNSIFYALSMSNSQIMLIQSNIKRHLINNFSIESKSQKLIDMYDNLK